MHIILVSNRLATARTLIITPRTVALAASAFIVLAFLTSFFFSWIGVRFNLPYASDLVESVQQVHNLKTEEYLRDNIKTMAIKLGEMQAQLVRLDLLGERVAKQSGIPLPKSEAAKGGAGGPLVNPSQPFGPDGLRRELERLSSLIEGQTESLAALESQLMERRVKTTLLPTLVPINAEHIGSPFGSRVDPIAGVGAMHEGIDFVADTGTRIVASAGGVVSVAEHHSSYGNMIEIDHGNDFSSRYAHLSKLDVKPGQLVKRGQLIGLSGNTGRSTGPHLHFEVRYRGIAQNPMRFFQMGAGTQLALAPAESDALRKVAVPARKSARRPEQSTERVRMQFDARQ